MKEEKSFLYTLVLGVCIIISLLLIGKMLLYHPAPVHTPHMAQTEPGGEKTMYISESDLTKLLAQQLPENFPVEDITVTLLQSGEVRAAGTVQKAGLSAVGTLRSALLWMPEAFSIETTFFAASDGAKLTLTPASVRAAGFALPAEHIPQEWVQILNSAVNSALQQSYGTYRAVRFLDGGMQLLQDVDATPQGTA